MEQSPSWVLSHLWKKDALFYSRVPLLDTIVPDFSVQIGYRWFFLDKHGFVKRKSAKRTAIGNILKQFLDTMLEGMESIPELYDPEYIEPHSTVVWGSFVNIENSYKVLRRKDFLQLVCKHNVPQDSFVQVFRKPAGDNSVRMYVNCKSEGRRWTYRYYKTYKSENREVTHPITAATLTAELKTICDDVVKVVTKNSKQIVLELTLCCIQDTQRKIWLLGSSFCKTDTKKTESLEPQEVTSRLATHHKNSSISSFSRPMSSISKATFSSLRSCASAFNFPKVKRATCPGDFCNYELASHVKHRQAETDLEDLVIWT